MKTSICGADTVKYPLAKSTGFQLLNIASNGIKAVGQWYPTPQTIEILGFEFFASIRNGSVLPQSVTCKLYVSGADSLPLGNPLASIWVWVDTAYQGGNLNAMRRFANFGRNVSLTGGNGFVLVIENENTTPVSILSNNYMLQQADGRNEWLSSYYNGNSFQKLNKFYPLAGFAFDADFIIQPLVSYQNQADFPTQICGETLPATAAFSFTGSAILNSKFYNKAVFYGDSTRCIAWDFGDSTPLQYGRQTVHGFNGPKYQFTVNLYDTIWGWTRSCTDRISKSVVRTPHQAVTASNSPVCTGNTLLLYTDSIPGATYSWQGPSGFKSNQRNPIISGFTPEKTGYYTVQVNVAGCMRNIQGNTQVNSPVTVVVTNSSPVCKGNQVYLYAPYLQGAQYTWTGPSNFISTQRSPVVYNLQAKDTGIYQLTIISPGCGLLGPFYTRVQMLPSPGISNVTGNSPVCEGDTLFLSASGPSDGTYLWLGPGNFSSQSDKPVRTLITPNLAGTYKVLWQKDGCVSDTNYISILVNARPLSPNISSNSPLCLSQTLELQTNADTGVSVVWKGPGLFNSTGNHIEINQVNFSDSGIYTAYVQSGACRSLPAQTRVQIGAKPQLRLSGNNNVCRLQNLNAGAISVPEATFHWWGPQGFNSSTQNIQITHLTDSASGVYRCVSYSDACGYSDTMQMIVNVLSVPYAPEVNQSAQLCTGDTLMLSMKQVPNAQYHWVGPGGFSTYTKDTQILNIKHNMSGVYLATISITGCGTSAPASVIITVRTKPSLLNISGKQLLCEDDTLKLNAETEQAGPNAQILWKNQSGQIAAGSQWILPHIQKNQSGIFEAMAFDSGCFSVVQSKMIDVMAAPQKPVLNSNSPVCAGSGFILEASNATQDTITWKFAEDKILKGSQLIFPAADSTLNGTFWARSEKNGCYSAWVPITGNIIPLPFINDVSSNSPVCEGSQVSFHASEITGALYNWQGPGFLSYIPNPVIDYADSSMEGYYQVSALKNGCQGPPSITFLTINKRPTLPIVSTLPSEFVCIEDSLKLMAQSSLNAEYFWVGPNGFTSQLQKPTLKIDNISQGGTYSVNAKLNGCESEENSVYVDVVAIPLNGSIYGEDTTNLNQIYSYETETTVVNSSCYWNIDGGTIINGNSTSKINVKWDRPGIGRLDVTEVNVSGCMSTKRTAVILVKETNGIHKLTSSTIMLYPNPATERVSCTGWLTGEYSILLTDETGRILLENTLHPSELVYDIDTKHLTNGLYFVIIKNEEKFYRSPLVIQNR